MVEDVAKGLKMKFDIVQGALHFFWPQTEIGNFIWAGTFLFLFVSVLACEGFSNWTMLIVATGMCIYFTSQALIKLREKKEKNQKEADK